MSKMSILKKKMWDNGIELPWESDKKVGWSKHKKKYVKKRGRRKSPPKPEPMLIKKFVPRVIVRKAASLKKDQ